MVKFLSIQGTIDPSVGIVEVPDKRKSAKLMIAWVTREETQNRSISQRFCACFVSKKWQL